MQKNTRKTLLIIGAGIESCEGIKIAKSMGLYLIVADGNPNAPGFQLADERIIVSTYNGKGILEALTNTEKTIDGVIAMCTDVPLSAAIVSNALNLPGLSIASAQLVSNKLEMKDALAKHGVPIPKYRPVSATDNDENIISELGLPLVIKPIDSRGARGVQLIDKIEDLKEAIKIAEENSPTSSAMAEEYLLGPQISTETLIENGEAFTIGFSDRNYSDLNKTKPYFIENGGDAPSSLSKDDQSDVIITVERAALALGIDQGVAKGDMVLTSNGAKVIEIAGRLSGGYFSTTQIPLSTGVNFVEQAIRLCIGEKLDRDTISPRLQQAVAIRYLPFKPGKIQSITGIKAANNSCGVELFKLFVCEGSVLGDLQNHTQRAGFIICTAPTKKQAIERANIALSKVDIHYA